MKKFITLLSALSLMACSSDSDEAVTNQVATLDGATISPQVTSVIGYFKGVDYVLSKNGQILNNYDYEWSVSDTLKGWHNRGNYRSRLIGDVDVFVKDAAGNTLTASVKNIAAVTDIPEIPYVKWGATRQEIINGVAAAGGWSLIYDQWPWLDLKFKKGNHIFEYNLSGSTGLHRVYFIYNYASITNSGGVTESSKLVNYNNERFLQVSPSDTHWYGYSRWWYKNALGQMVYLDIESNATQTLYKLRYLGT